VTPTARERLDEFVAAFSAAFTAGTLLRLKLGGYRGHEPDLKSVQGRPVLVKSAPHLSLVFRHARRDITRNLPVDEATAWLASNVGTTFVSARLETTGEDILVERQGDKVRLTRAPVAGREPPSLDHDKAKVRPVAAEGQAYLNALGLTDAKGAVLKTAQDKYRQINRMVEILAPLIQAIPKDRLKRIVDMGAGKGYLTFFLHDYLRHHGFAHETIGVELRADLVEAGNRTAQASGLDGLSFVEGSIGNAPLEGVDVVIALHACDTATDDAIARGIAAGADLIAVAPCCHKQVRREMEAHPHLTQLDDLLRHGIFLERQAEMVTDTLRAQLLELSGYKVRVFEFVADAHTPKNVLIVAQKDRRPADREATLARIASTKAAFGVGRHYLETLLGL
jgi:SAM-dependent methyltransferase